MPIEYLSHKERYEHGVRKSCILFTKFNTWQEKNNDDSNLTETYMYAYYLRLYKRIKSCEQLYYNINVKNFRNFLRLVNSAIIKGSSPFTVHYLMFIPTIMSQGTSEQQAEWVGRAFSNQILGTYAQVSLQFFFC